MLHRKGNILVAAIAVIVRSASSSLPTDDHGDYNGSELIKWVRSHPDGIVHESLRIGRSQPGDKSSLTGLFVEADAKPIEIGETIAQIPWEHIISPGKTYRPYKFFSCRAVYNLAKELKLGNKSKRAPYVQYLLSQTRGTMPGEFTKVGKEFLSTVLGHGDLPPYEETWKTNFQHVWLDECFGDEESEVEKSAFYLASSRDEDTLMVPIYDMANHSNDPELLNTLSFKPENAGDVFKFVASARIEPGGQVYNSYNRCNHCADVDKDDCETFSSYRTPDIYASFGFVEPGWQSWEFDRFDDREFQDDEEFEFCLEQNAKTGELEVHWDEEDGMPDDEDAEWIEEQLKRLDQLLEEKDKYAQDLVVKSGDEASDKKMTQWEWDSIWNYHGAVKTALNAALVSSNKSIGQEDEL